MIDTSSGPATGATPRPDGRTDDLRERWRKLGGTSAVLGELVKSELRRGFSEGLRPAVVDFLDELPELRDDSDRMLSLIYEEFCLREEAGDAPDPDSFCERYAPWKDSLASQLNYHRMLSQAAGVLPGAPPRFPEPGEHFMRFRLRSVLGQGGAARVFLADDEDLGGRLSALKVSPDRGEEPSIMGRLQHPHIMPVLTVVRDPQSGLRGLCMPYRPGRPLDQVIRRMEHVPVTQRTAPLLIEGASPDELPESLDRENRKDFPLHGSYAEACAWLGLTMAEALTHSHGRGILHRDVKPANILMSTVDGPQLLDFNLAHDPHAPERAESALRGGTLPYMAPEQLEAFRDPERWDQVGPTADIYALGLVLRELLTGQRPEAPAADVPLPRAINELLAMRSDGWTPVRSKNPGVPHALEAILRRCIEHDPTRRYPSASNLAEDLRAFLRHRPLIHATNPSRRESLRNWYLRHRISLAALTLVVLIPTTALLATRGVIRKSDDYVGMGFMLVSRAERIQSDPAKTKMYAEARDYFAKALKLQPQNFKAYRGIGAVSIQMEEFGPAVDYLSEAIDISRQEEGVPSFELAQMHVHRAEALLRQNSPKSTQDEQLLARAREDLDRAEQLLPPPLPSQDAVRTEEELDWETLRARLNLWRARERIGRALLTPEAMELHFIRESEKHLSDAINAELLDVKDNFAAKKLHDKILKLLDVQEQMVSQ